MARRRENQNSTAAICLRSTCRSSPNCDCHREELSWATSFVSRPAGHFNSIFVDGFALLPQTDVWSRDAVDSIANGSQKQIVTATSYST